VPQGCLAGAQGRRGSPGVGNEGGCTASSENQQRRRTGRDGAKIEGLGRAAATRLLARFGFHPRKGLGQHFLVDGRVLEKILQAAQLDHEDTVIEVGPGLGVLTQALAKRAGRVIAVELDRGLAEKLRQGLPQVEVVEGDILSLSPLQLLGHPVHYKVVANIPYYITSPILRHFLEAEVKPRLMVVMVQREVGKAIVARPGEMSLLSVSVQFYSQPKLVAKVSPFSFYPPPQVESALLRLEVYEHPPMAVEDPGTFFQLVGAGFTAPRKQLHNSLAQGLGITPEEASRLLERATIDPKRRAQTLSLEEWAHLHQRFLDAQIKGPCQG
jgi:16S rRNA (adenine1518-N6/adenine1519-N6)-dimethyltransferase